MENKRKSLNNAEWYVTLAMLLVCGLLAWQITEITVAESRILPVVSLVIMLGASASMAVSLLGKKAGFHRLADAGFKKKELLVLAMLLASVLLYERLGFYTTIALLSLGTTLVLEAPLTLKKLLRSVLYTVVLMALVYFCFAVCLRMVTPSGVLI
ncbi:MAG: hypothetical protein HFE84_01080 [Lachnospiraceae bacterium]|jgi:hypothetical protein|nr:hypothetical protein [Lachnospiraceae bacterium]